MEECSPGKAGVRLERRPARKDRQHRAVRYGAALLVVSSVGSVLSVERLYSCLWKKGLFNPSSCLPPGSAFPHF